jgi:hypothetical protein
MQTAVRIEWGWRVLAGQAVSCAGVAGTRSGFLGILRLTVEGVYWACGVDIKGGGRDCVPYMVLAGFPTSRKSRDVGHPVVAYRDLTVIWISGVGLFSSAG